MAFMLDPEVRQGLEGVKMSLTAIMTAMQALISTSDAPMEPGLQALLDWMLLQPLHAHVVVLEALLATGAHDV